jgi:uncharacterized protein with GYD domain
MSRYALLFSYTPETWRSMIKNPEDRAAAVRALLETSGGTLESMYFMFGGRDGIVIFDVPDADTAAGISIAVTSTGSFGHIETSELIEPERLVSVLGKAGQALGHYRVPGS